jgi:DNA-binding CsgD family transcriptional regulator
MVEIDDFFIQENRVDHLPEEAYKNIDRIVGYVDAFARITYKSIYVIDYYKQNFLYVSDNPLFLCGLTAEEVKKLGYSFYISQVTPEDLPLLLGINTAGFLFYKDVPVEERTEYTLSYDFYVIDKISGKKTLIHHQITPFRLTENGQLWLALCAVSISSSSKSGNIVIKRKNSSDYWHFNRTSRKWEKMSHPKLKSVEIEVLRFSAMGYTMSEIADEVHRSLDTVKMYRKDIFEKLEVDNIATAISYAKNHRLI